MMIRYEFGARVDRGPFLERQKEWKRGPVCNIEELQNLSDKVDMELIEERKDIKLLQSFQPLREAIQKSTKR